MNRIVHLYKTGHAGRDRQRHGQKPPALYRSEKIEREQKPRPDDLNKYLRGLQTQAAAKDFP